MISVIVPVFNNKDTLVELTRKIYECLTAENFEIIYINDGSKDDSLNVLKNIAAENSRVKVIDLSRNFGQHPATCAGLEQVSSDRVVLMDADLQDRPENIPVLLEKLSDETDIVYSIRKDSGKKIFVLFFSRNNLLFLYPNNSALFLLAEVIMNLLLIRILPYRIFFL